MSLLYTLVFASRCRSNHHRIAVDALRHLRSPKAEAWRNALLHFHDDYLKGAKAPDDEFKDFKNHVLHVREKEWGGAIEACEEWYRRTVRALMAKDWRQAAWSAGVLSHYFCDPIQPFHTHQTEEENIIHRAVEWSFSKSYGVFQRILEQDLGGYPDIEAPAGETWLAEMVRAGARASNAHYELVIDHYNFDVGVKDPPAGLDQELKDTIAKLVGHAVIGFARVLDRAIEEAAVKPPKVETDLQALFLTLQIPIQAVLKHIDDAAARREVQAQYDEFQRTGKVRATLGEDDKVVRELHAAEVLKAPLSSLDAKWPREVGAKAGEGAPARDLPKRARTSPPRRVIDLDAPAPKPAPRPKPAPAAERVPPRELPHGAPLAKKDKTLPRFALSEDAPVVQAPSIGPKTAKRLEAVGVKTVADLLSMNADEGEDKIDARHISARVIRDWQAQALLACTVPGLKSREAQALVAAGVRSADDLIAQDATELCEAVAQWGLSDEGQRAWGSAAAPTPDDVATWIARAQRAREDGAASAAAA
jgi:predicted flap endonuclease-1-like 5' DNA nuclease